LKKKLYDFSYLVKRPKYDKSAIVENQLRPLPYLIERKTISNSMIKIYRDHEGSPTCWDAPAGAELILHDVFGAIQQRSVFVLQEVQGITPFISIFRDFIHKKNQVEGKQQINLQQ
jgi:hypothetical protein